MKSEVCVRTNRADRHTMRLPDALSFDVLRLDAVADLKPQACPPARKAVYGEWRFSRMRPCTMLSALKESFGLAQCLKNDKRFAHTYYNGEYRSCAMGLPLWSSICRFCFLFVGGCFLNADIYFLSITSV